MTPAQKELYDGAIRMLDKGMWHEGGWNLRVLSEAMAGPEANSWPPPERTEEWKADYALVLKAHSRACDLQANAIRASMGLKPISAQPAAKGFFSRLFGKQAAGHAGHRPSR